MKIDILTLFPNMFKGPFDESIIKRAQEKDLVEINIHNLRDWAKDKHKNVDDKPYGGGTGMVIRVDVVEQALSTLRVKERESGRVKERIVLLSPQGEVFSQRKAGRLAKREHLILIAGHYEGFDERIREHLVDEEISIGDYILTGGELPTMVIVDTIVRLIPGVLEKEEATESESFQPKTYNLKPTTLLEYPQYTRPADFKGWKVPKVLLSGNHPEIAEWRKKKALERTKKKRPDLVK
jgi:tRNA (guanine37-N1)-methyltransferase